MGGTYTWHLFKDESFFWRGKASAVGIFLWVSVCDGSVHKKEAIFVEKLSTAIHFQNPFELVADDQPDKKFQNAWMAARELWGIWHGSKNALRWNNTGWSCLKKKTWVFGDSIEIVLANKEKSAALLNSDDVSRRDVFLNFSNKFYQNSNLTPAGNSVIAVDSRSMKHRRWPNMLLNYCHKRQLNWLSAPSMVHWGCVGSMLLGVTRMRVWGNAIVGSKTSPHPNSVLWKLKSVLSLWPLLLTAWSHGCGYLGKEIG